MSLPRPEVLYIKMLVAAALLLGSSWQMEASCIYSKAFAVQELEIGNLLTWSTRAERNNQSFVIQKSLDGFEFKSEGVIRGAMDCDEERHYRFLDLTIGQHKVFYRLIDLDVKGNYSITHTLVLERETQNDLLITSMNGTSTKRFIELTLDSEIQEAVRYQVTNWHQQLVKEGELELVKGTNAMVFDFAELPNGKYRLSLVANEEREEILFRKDESADKPSNFALKNKE